MSKPKLISFDCYGTLIDWETGILSALEPVLAAHGCALPNAEILRRYARIESTLQKGPYQSYREILRGVTRQFGVELDFAPTGSELDAIPDSLPNWQPFPDTVAALKQLKRQHRLAILSNIDDDLFAATAKHLEVAFDLVITAQQLSCYKPERRNFEVLRERGGVAPSELLHAAESVYHDIIPARELGLKTAWVNRRNQCTISLTGPPDPREQPDFECVDLQALVELLGG